MSSMLSPQLLGTATLVLASAIFCSEKPWLDQALHQHGQQSSKPDGGKGRDPAGETGAYQLAFSAYDSDAAPPQAQLVSPRQAVYELATHGTLYTTTERLHPLQALTDVGHFSQPISF